MDKDVNNTFNISAVIKSNAFVNDVVKNILDLTKYFCKNDYVIVVGGISNSLKGVRIEEETIQNFI